MAMGIGALHHLDHILRADHSGWPFTATVTPLTWSFLAYPVLAFAWRARRSPALLRGASVALLAGFTLAAHMLIETPIDQFTMWARNYSTDPRAAGVENLLAVESPILGISAAALSMALNLLLVAIAAAFLAAGARQRRVEA